MGPGLRLPIAQQAWGLASEAKPCPAACQGTQPAPPLQSLCSTCLRPPSLISMLTCIRGAIPFALLDCRDHPLLPEGAAERGQQGRLLRLPGAGGEGGLLCFCHLIVPDWPPMCTGHLDPNSVLLPPIPSGSWPLTLTLCCAQVRAGLGHLDPYFSKLADGMVAWIEASGVGCHRLCLLLRWL